MYIILNDNDPASYSCSIMEIQFDETTNSIAINDFYEMNFQGNIFACDINNNPIFGGVAIDVTGNY